MNIKYNYELDSWQALLQQLVVNCSKQCKYYFWHITYFPVNKKDKWREIDEKLIERYETRTTKDQRNRMRKKGLARFYYMRWENIAIILHTEGVVPDGMIQDKFYDIRKKPIQIFISDLVSFDIQNLNNKIEVKLAEETYQTIKEELKNVAKSANNIRKIKNTYNKVNGFPAYSGIIKQKKELAKFLVKQTKKHNINAQKLEVPNLFIRMQRKTVRTWRKSTLDSKSDSRDT
ncbi:hypothetical protein [Bacillus cereus group sp. BfR-BA-01491]|uniref:hypothetical protein n=1 Tax=Bacillus cereus group sp. BfR-BA-01491 TaxID=2920360 RepID=UPI001F5673C8|nr:hypothetical protein [Bacillus cereus group sp. BfR-BA-01491]